MTGPTNRRTLLRGRRGPPWPCPGWKASRPSPGRAAKSGRPPVRCASGTSPTASISPPGSPTARGRWSTSPRRSDLSQVARDYLSTFHGLTHNTALVNGDVEGCGHGQGAASFLTGAQAFQTQDAVRVGISADQVYARHVGDETRLPSLELGCESGPLGQRLRLQRGHHKTHISWLTATSPAPYELNPKLVFDRLFTAGDRKSTGATIAERDAYRKSMIDFVLDDANRLRARVGTADRHQARRVPLRSPHSEVEQRILNAAPLGRGPRRGASSDRRSIPEDFDEHLRLMCDLQVLAFQTDSTRAASFMVTKEATDRNCPWLSCRRSITSSRITAARRRRTGRSARSTGIPHLDPSLHGRADDVRGGGRRVDSCSTTR